MDLYITCTFALFYACVHICVFVDCQNQQQPFASLTVTGDENSLFPVR